MSYKLEHKVKLLSLLKYLLKRWSFRSNFDLRNILIKPGNTPSYTGQGGTLDIDDPSKH